MSKAPRKPAHAPATRARRAKPVFEIPLEAARPATQEWVFRTEPPAAPPPPAPVLRQAPPPTQPRQEPSFFMAAGLGIFMLGVAAVGLASVALVCAVGMPIMLARAIVRR